MLATKLYLFLFIICIISFTIYSYALIDPNLTLVNHPLWVMFRDPLVYFGYHQRQSSTIVYILFLILLFLFHWYFTHNYKRFWLWKTIGVISIFSIFSYPFLSHDLFNYIFDAKILTFYGKNPYELTPGFFYHDEWLRFMHWTDRSYPYGPIFLPLTLIPSFLGAGKLILNFIFFKLLNVIFYILAVFFLNKLSKKSAVFFATNPLVIIEGLMNAHNDLIAVSLGIVGIYYLQNKTNLIARILLLASAGIKYLSFPIVFIQKNSNSKKNYFLLFLQITIFLYLFFNGTAQPWYFLSLLLFLPIYPKIVMHLNIFFLCLLLSYYPYIRFGNWDQIWIKEYFIGAGIVLNLIYLAASEKKILSYFKK